MSCCAICIEKMSNKDLVVLECCHMFHTECIIKLIKKKK